MEMVKMARQMIDFQKSISDNTYDVMMTLWDQGARMADMMLAGATWIPDEGKRTLNESLGIYRKGFEDMKGTLDEAFKSLQAVLAEAEKSGLPSAIVPVTGVPAVETPQ